mmetsp:Transcript_45104/g.79362  ORF Transcript_45104/g.79362 Transcript_45104/m.79362 type:complete len:298 (-) Transcript_45104:125-1018(-)
MWKFAFALTFLAGASHGRRIHRPCESSGNRHKDSESEFDSAQALAMVLMMFNPSTAFRLPAPAARSSLGAAGLAGRVIPLVRTSQGLRPLLLSGEEEEESGEKKVDEKVEEKVQKKAGEPSATRKFLSRKFDQFFRPGKIQAEKGAARLAAKRDAMEKRLAERDAAMVAIKERLIQEAEAEQEKQRKAQQLEMQKQAEQEAAKVFREEQRELEERRARDSQEAMAKMLSTRKTEVRDLAGMEKLKDKDLVEKERMLKIKEAAIAKKVADDKKREEEEENDMELYWERRKGLSGGSPR